MALAIYGNLSKHALKRDHHHVKPSPSPMPNKIKAENMQSSCTPVRTCKLILSTDRGHLPGPSTLLWRSARENTMHGTSLVLVDLSEPQLVPCSIEGGRTSELTISSTLEYVPATSVTMPIRNTPKFTKPSMIFLGSLHLPFFRSNAHIIGGK